MKIKENHQRYTSPLTAALFLEVNKLPLSSWFTVEKGEILFNTLSIHFALRKQVTEDDKTLNQKSKELGYSNSSSDLAWSPVVRKQSLNLIRFILPTANCVYGRCQRSWNKRFSVVTEQR